MFFFLPIKWSVLPISVQLCHKMLRCHLKFTISKRFAQPWHLVSFQMNIFHSPILFLIPHVPLCLQSSSLPLCPSLCFFNFLKLNYIIRPQSLLSLSLSHRMTTATSTGYCTYSNPIKVLTVFILFLTFVINFIYQKETGTERDAWQKPITYEFSRCVI